MDCLSRARLPDGKALIQPFDPWQFLSVDQEAFGEQGVDRLMGSWW
jgi:hypothetical protein